MSEHPAEKDAPRVLLRCGRVTGKAFEPHYWMLPASRRGPRRDADEVNPRKRTSWSHNPQPEAVYDVLCGTWARWKVEDNFACDRCLVAVMDKSGATSATVTRVIPPAVPEGGRDDG